MVDERHALKYKRLSGIINVVANCANNELILVGGTALALFYLKHRVSLDLDFIPVSGEETKLKEMLKGCLTKKGYRTSVGRYKNQFIIQFEDTSIKIEIFTSEYKIKKINEFEFGAAKLKVASLDDIFELKLIAYQNRKEARDIYDIISILELNKQDTEIALKLIKDFGQPVNEDELIKLIVDEERYKKYKEVIKNAV